MPAKRTTVVYDPTEPSRAVWSTQIPERFTETMKITDHGGYLLTLDVAWDGKRWTARGVRIEALDDGPPPPGEAIVHIGQHLAQLVDRACYRQAAAVAEMFGEDVDEVGRQWQAEVRAKRGPRHRRIPDELLKRVAEIYQEHENAAPKQAVRLLADPDRKPPPSLSTASAWIKAARQKGYLQ